MISMMCLPHHPLTVVAHFLQLEMLRNVAEAKVAMTNNAAQARTLKGEGIIGQILSGRNLRHMLTEQQKARKAAGMKEVLPLVRDGWGF